MSVSVPLTDPLSPCYSECDSVSGLLDEDNNLTSLASSKLAKRDILSQMVQTFRFPRSRQYSTLGSCPNLAHLTSRTLVLKDSAGLSDKLLNVNTPYGSVQIFKTGNPQGPYLLTLHDLGLNGFSNYATLFQSEDMEPVLCPKFHEK